MYLVVQTKVFSAYESLLLITNCQVDHPTEVVACSGLR
jgi:hypothetical protein